MQKFRKSYLWKCLDDESRRDVRIFMCRAGLQEWWESSVSKSKDQNQATDNCWCTGESAPGALMQPFSLGANDIILQGYWRASHNYILQKYRNKHAHLKYHKNIQLPYIWSNTLFKKVKHNNISKRYIYLINAPRNHQVHLFYFYGDIEWIPTARL